MEKNQTKSNVSKWHFSYRKESSLHKLQDGVLQWVGLYDEDIKALNYRSISELILTQPKKEIILSVEVWNKWWSSEAEIQEGCFEWQELKKRWLSNQWCLERNENQDIASLKEQDQWQADKDGNEFLRKNGRNLGRTFKTVWKHLTL